jgi:hypothetical protein
MDKMFKTTATEFLNQGRDILKKAEKTVNGVVEQGSSALNQGTTALQHFPTQVPSNLEIAGHKITFIKLLDEGGFSFVYLVKDETGQNYALKQLIAQEREMYEKIAEEIKYMQLLSGKTGIINLIGTKVLQTKNKKNIYILMVGKNLNLQKLRN